MSGYFNPTEKSCQVPTGQDVGWPWELAWMF
jgi:hypothetical protein